MGSGALSPAPRPSLPWGVPPTRSTVAPREPRPVALSPGRHRCQDAWGVGPLISHIIFGISHSLGELENVIVKVFLNICLLSRKTL